MNIKKEIRIQKIKNTLSAINNAIFIAPYERSYEKGQAKAKRKRDERVAYNKGMSDKELIQRMLRCILKDAIKRNRKIIEFYWCEGMLRYDIRQDRCFILNQLCRVNDDKYINTWLDDNNYSQSHYTLMGDIERRLHLEMRRQLEEMDVKISYKVDETLDRYWRSDSHYVKTLVIELPLF